MALQQKCQISTIWFSVMFIVLYSMFKVQAGVRDGIIAEAKANMM